MRKNFLPGISGGRNRKNWEDFRVISGKLREIYGKTIFLKKQNFSVCNKLEMWYIIELE